jgi:hypothetical protein
MTPDHSPVPRRRLLAPSVALFMGVLMIAAGLVGVGTSSADAAASSFNLTFATTTSGSVVVRWAPCVKGADGAEVIAYKVHTAGKPGRVRLVKRAIGRLHDATGLRFKYAGRTSYIPQSERLVQRLDAATMERRTNAPLVVAWARKGDVSGGSTLLTGSEAGVGSIIWRYSSRSQLRLSDAAVIVRRGPSGLKSGFGAGGTVGTLLLHELGHAVGLRHVEDKSQVMYPVIGSWSPGRYAGGDRNGLKQVGAAAGCMSGKWVPAG